MCAAQFDDYISAYHLPDDGLNLEEHLWIDVATPAVADETSKAGQPALLWTGMLSLSGVQVLQECFQEMAQDYIMQEWAERILSELLQVHPPPAHTLLM